MKPTSLFLIVGIVVFIALKYAYDKGTSNV